MVISRLIQIEVLLERKVSFKGFKQCTVLKQADQSKNNKVVFTRTNSEQMNGE
jgi:hypothetical protein